MRLAPTTLTGVSGSRSPPVIAVHSFGTFSGNFFSAFERAANMCLVWLGGQAERGNRAGDLGGHELGDADLPDRLEVGRSMSLAFLVPASTASMWPGWPLGRRDRHRRAGDGLAAAVVGDRDGLPPPDRGSCRSCAVQDGTGWLLTARILSPGCRPSCFAGLAGSLPSTQATCRPVAGSILKSVVTQPHHRVHDRGGSR